MLPNPIPYFELEALSLWQHFFLLESCFLIAFSSLSIFLLNCATECYTIWFLSAFLSGKEIGFFCSVFLVHTTILGIVHGRCAPMLLSEVAMILGASFLGDSDCRLSTRLLVSFLALVGRSLAGLCVGLFLHTYVLYSLTRHKK